MKKWSKAIREQSKEIARGFLLNVLQDEYKSRVQAQCLPLFHNASFLSNIVQKPSVMVISLGMKVKTSRFRFFL